jgi:hypothetical protein
MTVKIDGSNGLLQAYDYQVLTTGFSYTFAAGTQVLLAVPAGTLATGTVVMPTTPADGMNITITSTQEITALTVNANTGQSIVGGGASYLPANGSRTFIYRLSNTTWYPQAVAIPQPLTDIQTFNAGDADLTWDKPTGGQTMVKIQVWAGGGGGSRAAATGGTAGGGGGAYNEWIGPISYMGATAAVTVGAAGVGRITSAGVGTAGGNSSIAIANYPGGSKTIIAYGGGGANQGGSIYGGGGGGLLGAGTSTAGAAGIGYESPADATNNASGSVPAITAGGLGNNSTTIPYGSIYGGGGGSTNGSTGLGGRSVYGGGGGVSTGGTAGVSLYGGAGGVNAIGSTPAGGGGSSSTANTYGSKGGAGQVVITSW